MNDITTFQGQLVVYQSQKSYFYLYTSIFVSWSIFLYILYLAGIHNRCSETRYKYRKEYVPMLLNISIQLNKHLTCQVNSSKIDINATEALFITLQKWIVAFSQDSCRYNPGILQRAKSLLEINVLSPYINRRAFIQNLILRCSIYGCDSRNLDMFYSLPWFKAKYLQPIFKKVPNDQVLKTYYTIIHSDLIVLMAEILTHEQKNGGRITSITKVLDELDMSKLGYLTHSIKLADKILSII